MEMIWWTGLAPWALNSLFRIALYLPAARRPRAKKGQFKRFSGLLPESQGQNVAWTLLCAPDLLDSGLWQ
jgi:hypothetical protein